MSTTQAPYQGARWQLVRNAYDFFQRMSVKGVLLASMNSVRNPIPSGDGSVLYKQMLAAICAKASSGDLSAKESYMFLGAFRSPS